MLVLIGFIFLQTIPDGKVYPVDIDYTEGWISEEGNPVNAEKLDHSDGVHSISRLIDADDVEGASLCCEAANLIFDVYLDNELIYSFHPQLSGFYGKYYGSYPHFITIPQFEGTKTLTIDYVSLFDSDWTAFRDMSLIDADVYFRTIMQNGWVRFIQCFVILLTGLIMVLFAFIFDQDRERFTETIALGVIAVILACYSNSGSLLIQAITTNSAELRIIELTSLMLLPIPTIIFIGSFTDMLNRWYVKALIISASVNTVVSHAIVRITDLDFHDLLFVSHAIIIIGLVMCFYMIVKHVRKKKKHRGVALLVISSSIVFMGGIGDLIRYYVADSRDTAMLTRYGLMVFIILMGYNEVKELIAINQKSIKTEIMLKVAYTDALTGIPNREAFYVLENEIKQKDNYRCNVIQLDLNYLKKANDEFGHAEGDKLIKAAAQCIDDSLGEYGKCFRTGGDEFIAIIDKDLDKALKAFTDKTEEINNDKVINLQVPLSIAYGIAEYVSGKDSLEDVEALADSRMYKNKKKMKAERKD